MTGGRVYNVLFLCTGNSARSILAESIVNHLGGGRFKGFSAGSQPKGEVHPYVLDLLAAFGLSSIGMHSKSWDVFAGAGAPRMDFIFTVCDNAAGEACPVWLGQPMTAHWGIPDPAAVGGSEAEKRAAFRHAFASLESRIGFFMNLPLATLDGMALQQRLDAIGRTPPSTAAA
jgi:arsenate reductase